MHLPSVVRQMGKVTGENRVYIEDYVYTYLNELKKEKNNLPVRVALYGHTFSREDIHFYLIYGASCIVEEMENGRDQDEIRRLFFSAYNLIGYVNIYGKQELPGTEEGCFIFYESNEAMQNYMLSCYKRKNRLKEDPKRKRRDLKVKQETEEIPFFAYIKEILQKAFFCLAVMFAATAVAIISNYRCMYDFTMMAVRAVQTVG
ncbi:MAG: hypothetical protein ACI4ED_06690 [Suilimivivens sp.]